MKKKKKLIKINQIDMKYKINLKIATNTIQEKMMARTKFKINLPPKINLNKKRKNLINKRILPPKNNKI